MQHQDVGTPPYHTSYAAVRRGLLAVLAALFAALGGCAALPPPIADYRFDIGAEAPAQSEWSLPAVAESAGIQLDADFYDEVNDNSVSMIELNFGKRDPQHYNTRISIADPGCEGIYHIAVAYYTDERTIQNQYFDYGLRWGTPLHLNVSWSEGSMTVTVNNRESKTLPLRYGPRLLKISATRGGLRDVRLHYAAAR